MIAGVGGLAAAALIADGTLKRELRQEQPTIPPEIQAIRDQANATRALAQENRWIQVYLRTNAFEYVMAAEDKRRRKGAKRRRDAGEV